MAELDELKTAVQQSTELWKSGRVLEALHMLDDLIAKAAEEKREIWVKVLAMHASTMSHLIGDLNSTRRYCEQVLAHDPNNALALFKMADVPFQQGKQEEGTALAERSYALAAASDTREGEGLIELLRSKWPEVGGPQT